MGWPWKWWEVSFSSAELETIEKVKQEFQEEPVSTSNCKGTNRYGGNPNYNGTGEHIIIQFDYMNQHPGIAEREFAIPFSSALGNTGYADIVNTGTKEIFEIKPGNNQIEISNGRVEVGKYVEKPCLFCGGGFVKGFNYPERIFPYPGKPDKNMRVYKEENGIIVYEEVTKSSQPVPVPVPQPVSDKLKQFFNFLMAFNEISEEMTVYWLKQNPAIREYLIAAGVGLIIATIIEDFVTLGAGAVDDIPTIMLAMKLIRIAKQIP